MQYTTSDSNKYFAINVQFSIKDNFGGKSIQLWLEHQFLPELFSITIRHCSFIEAIRSNRTLELEVSKFIFQVLLNNEIKS